MSKALYTAQAHVAGGRNGRGRTTDGRLDLDLRQPKELGGDGEGANPEQLFAIGYAACFGATLALIGQRAELKAHDAEIDSSVSLIPIDGGRFKLRVELRISLPSVTGEQAFDLARTADQVCPYSDATRGNIDVAMVVNGTRL
ncbi:peroxiredoxin, Ohr subfamily/peroxiredoxin, SACOL1771 subfamily [Streptomyces sp. 1222.5]|uniref:organic hydroperoxide resistance protein n=1 Tax=unclassified Streptomyces TaxID=2593676 RepID=UPI00089B482D|nr:MULTISPECIES: organic hydroperoxide resistance protein [unclassified Streptomyces]PKW09705.1 Ohr subfamily peroxiredoxin/peroxiredoxin-like protein [Streptomyces sp. 5112.2]SEC27264.1 peroxiredoxin, Ohr subfamily/peroxiredoxin, SACOL1771 subfamily [Streptomyces sp. 1222.5]